MPTSDRKTTSDDFLNLPKLKAKHARVKVNGNTTEVELIDTHKLHPLEIPALINYCLHGDD